ncbi:MAG: carboxypeptidase regulatory-like domain-containing protein [Blastocatellales bacterium]
MRNVLSLSAILLFCINVSVFGQATVSGRVTIGSQPAAGIEVMLTSSDPAVLNNNPPPPISAQTDPDGRYKLTSVPAGSYRISAYAPAWVAKVEGNQGWLGRTLSVSDGENVENIDFIMTRGAVITGRVTDSSGRGLIEENIVIIPVDADGRRLNSQANRSAFVRTDDRGVYRAFGLPAGRYRVGAGPEPGNARIGTVSGGRYMRTWHPDTIDESAAGIVAVETGQEAEKVDITMVAADKNVLYSASGRVIEAETGAPVAGAMIMHTQMKGDQPEGAAMNSTASNSRGEFRIDSIPAGSYTLTAVILQGGESYSEPVRFEIESGDVSGLEVRMIRGGSISGRIEIEGGAPPEVIAGLTKIEVSAGPAEPRQLFPFGGRGRVQPDGSFRIAGLPPGKFWIRYSNMVAPKGLNLIRIEHNGADGSMIELRERENLTGLRLIMQYGSGTLAGRVEVRNGTIPAGSRMIVTAMRSGAVGAPEFYAEVDNRGHFVLDGLAAGNYTIRLGVSIPGAGGQSTEQQVSVAGSGRQEVTLVLDLSRSGKEDE